MIVRMRILFVFMGLLLSSCSSEEAQIAQQETTGPLNCDDVTGIDSRAVLPFEARGIPDSDNDSVYQLRLVLDGSESIQTIGISKGDDSTFSSEWRFARSLVTEARAAASDKNSEIWIRAANHGDTIYAYIPQDLGAGKYLYCFTWQPSDTELVFDGGCKIVGRQKDLYYTVSLLDGVTSKVEFSNVAKQVDYVLRCLRD